MQNNNNIKLDVSTVMEIVYKNKTTDALNLLQQYPNDQVYKDCILTLKNEYENNIQGITFQDFFRDSYFCDGIYYREDPQELIDYAKFCKKCYSLMERAQRIKMCKYSVYVHENLLNGKIYVGLTAQNPNSRWGGGSHYAHNSHFSSEIEEYGWDNFSHEIVAENLTDEEAKELEARLIKLYNSTSKGLGYNVDKYTDNRGCLGKPSMCKGWFWITNGEEEHFVNDLSSYPGFHKGRNRIWITDGKTERLIPASQISLYTSKGFEKGRLKKQSINPPKPA